MQQMLQPQKVTELRRAGEQQNGLSETAPSISFIPPLVLTLIYKSVFHSINRFFVNKLRHLLNTKHLLLKASKICPHD